MAGLVDEAKDGQNTPLNADLDTGLDQLSYSQVVTFTKYVRVVLPIDGYVFWVRADLLTPSALLNISAYNVPVPNADGPLSITPALQVDVKGSFHYATDMSQEEDNTYSSNRVIFTAQEPIQAFNEIGPNVIFIGEFASPERLGDGTVDEEGETIRFAFSQRGSFYLQAELYHYAGHAIYSTLASQIIDDPRDLDTRQIVSNSLPIWLSMNSYVINAEWELFPKPGFVLFPSFLADQNEIPPYATVHIEGTTAIESTPAIYDDGSHSQLCSETVRITLYGTRNQTGLDFVDFVNQFSVNTDLIGIMNMPVLQDEKKTQVEFNMIAMKKTITYEISYYQNLARDLARQLIKEVIINYFLGHERFN